MSIIEKNKSIKIFLSFFQSIKKSLKEWINEISSENSEIMKYLKNNIYIVYITIFFTILAHGVALSYYKIGYDSDNAILSYNSNGWIVQGRFGIAILKKIFTTDTITIPIYNVFLGLIMLVLFGIVSMYIINKYLEGANKLATTSFLITFITFSQIPTYITFTMYSFEVSMGYFLVAISFLFISKYILDMFLGVILLMLSISIYQSFVSLYVSFVCITCLTKNCVNKEQKIIDEIVDLGKFVLALIGALITYTFINFILTNSIINGNGYLGGFIGWKNSNFIDVILNTINTVKNVIVGENLYGFVMLRLSYIFLFIISIIVLVKYKKINSFTYLIGFMISPFILNFMLGSTQPIRSLVTLPFFVGMFAYILVLTFKNRNMQKIIFVGIFFIGFYQAQYTSRLYFGDYIRYEQDVELGNRIAQRIEELDLGENPKYPVVYIGKHSTNNKPLIMREEILGYSFFEWSDGEPLRMKNFMDIIGHKYVKPSKADIKNAYAISQEMSVWPYSGSVKLEKNLIVVKLSEPTDRWLKKYELK